MKRATLLLLALLALASYALWWRKERALTVGQMNRPVQSPLLAGLRADRVRALRIDHLERSVQVALERDAAGSWFLTDPIEYPATDSLVHALLRDLAAALGAPAEVSPADAGLDPPRIVLELLQSDEPQDRRLRLEIGTPGLDPARVYVRARQPGTDAAEVFLAPRSIDTLLDRNPDDYRERRISHLRPRDVVELTRSGRIFLGDRAATVDLELRAEFGEGHWARTDGPRVSLAPEAIHLVLRGLCDLRASAFRDDAPRDWTVWGLDPPAFRIAVREVDGGETILEFGHLPTGDLETPAEELTWTCRRRGFDHVFELDPDDVQLLASPAEQLYDYRLVRAFRRDMVRLVLDSPRHRLVLAREGTAEHPRWTLDVRPPEGEGPGRGYTADPTAVEDALALLERTELGDYPGGPFEPGPTPLGFALETAAGERFGGRLGAPRRDAEGGAEGRLFLRAGDELTGWVPEAVAELCGAPPDRFRSRVLLRFGESNLEAELRSLVLEVGGRRVSYVNDGANRWHVEGGRAPAPRALTRALDKGLLSLTARAFRPPPQAGPLDSELTVELHDRYGGRLEFRLGRAPDGAVLWLGSQGQCAEVDPEPYEALLRALAD